MAAAANAAAPRENLLSLGEGRVRVPEDSCRTRCTLTPALSRREREKFDAEQSIHLLIEKPIATSVEEADHILDAAARHNCRVQVGHIERFNPAWNQPTLLCMLRNPKYIEACRTSGYTFRSTDIGAVLDIMIH